MLELLDTEEQVLVGLAVRDAGAAQALLYGGVHQAASPRRALARATQDVRDEGTAFRALYPALLDQMIDDLLNPLAGGGSGPYLQKYQAFQPVEHKALLYLGLGPSRRLAGGGLPRTPGLVQA
jgi:hypothetical protein